MESGKEASLESSEETSEKLHGKEKIQKKGIKNKAAPCKPEEKRTAYNCGTTENVVENRDFYAIQQNSVLSFLKQPVLKYGNRVQLAHEKKLHFMIDDGVKVVSCKICRLEPIVHSAYTEHLKTDMHKKKGVLNLLVGCRPDYMFKNRFEYMQSLIVQQMGKQKDWLIGMDNVCEFRWIQEDMKNDLAFWLCKTCNSYGKSVDTCKDHMKSKRHETACAEKGKEPKSEEVETPTVYLIDANDARVKDLFGTLDLAIRFSEDQQEEREFCKKLLSSDLPKEYRTCFVIASTDCSQIRIKCTICSCSVSVRNTLTTVHTFFAQHCSSPLHKTAAKFRRIYKLAENVNLEMMQKIIEKLGPHTVGKRCYLIGLKPIYQSQQKNGVFKKSLFKDILFCKLCNCHFHKWQCRQHFQSYLHISNFVLWHYPQFIETYGRLDRAGQEMFIAPIAKQCWESLGRIVLQKFKHIPAPVVSNGGASSDIEVVPQVQTDKEQEVITVDDDVEEGEVRSDEEIEIGEKEKQTIVEGDETKVEEKTAAPKNIAVIGTTRSMFLSGVFCRICSREGHMKNDCPYTKVDLLTKRKSDETGRGVRRKRRKHVYDSQSDNSNMIPQDQAKVMYLPGVTCRRCSKEGHMHRECTAVICRRCSKEGHIDNECPEGAGKGNYYDWDNPDQFVNSYGYMEDDFDAGSLQAYADIEKDLPSRYKTKYTSAADTHTKHVQASAWVKTPEASLAAGYGAPSQYTNKSTVVCDGQMTTPTANPIPMFEPAKAPIKPMQLLTTTSLVAPPANPYAYAQEDTQSYWKKERQKKMMNPPIAPFEPVTALTTQSAMHSPQLSISTTPGIIFPNWADPAASLNYGHAISGSIADPVTTSVHTNFSSLLSPQEGQNSLTSIAPFSPAKSSPVSPPSHISLNVPPSEQESPRRPQSNVNSMALQEAIEKMTYLVKLAPKRVEAKKPEGPKDIPPQTRQDSLLNELVNREKQKQMERSKLANSKAAKQRAMGMSGQDRCEGEPSFENSSKTSAELQKSIDILMKMNAILGKKD